MDNKHKLSDEDIAKAKVNKKFLKKIYLHFIKEMYSYAFYIVKNKEVAEDVVSESFLKAFSNLSNFEGSYKEFRAWLYKITRNTAFDYSKKKTELLLEDNVLENISNEDKNAEAQEIWELISEFKPEVREILILRYKSGYSLKEVSEITGESYENVRQIISRTIKQLKKDINNDR